jgi:hypothetical protein
MHPSNSHKDLKLLLVFVMIASLVLLGIGIRSVVKVSTQETGLLIQSLALRSI